MVGNFSFGIKLHIDLSDVILYCWGIIIRNQQTNQKSEKEANQGNDKKFNMIRLGLSVALTHKIKSYGEKWEKEARYKGHNRKRWATTKNNKTKRKEANSCSLTGL